MTKKIKLPKVAGISPYLGCDPEFFFKKGRAIIGSEKLLPKEGFSVVKGSSNQTSSKFIIDGVQAELNPRIYTCRALLAGEISQCFYRLRTEINSKDASVKMDFSRSIKMTKKALAELDPNNQKFGCAPSFSAYKTEHKKITKVNPLKYLSRSAGGHIHIGINQYPTVRSIVSKTPEKVIHMLDIICGNTMVLVDRDPSNVKRRELYGRAGEYRLPEHGLEYRTLSNVWLTAYPLMSLAFGLARVAVELMESSNNELYYDAFTKAINLADIETAINTNDFDLAMSNFKKIEPLLSQVVDEERDHFPLSNRNMKEFYHFVDKINTEGLTYWFPTDPLSHWVDRADGRFYGIVDFLRTHVKDDIKKKGK